jgi:hypothetical protein
LYFVDYGCPNLSTISFFSSENLTGQAEEEFDIQSDLRTEEAQNYKTQKRRKQSTTNTRNDRALLPLMIQQCAIHMLN